CSCNRESPHGARKNAKRCPLPLWEREGPIAQRWEVEGRRRRRSLILRGAGSRGCKSNRSARQRSPLRVAANRRERRRLLRLARHRVAHDALAQDLPGVGAAARRRRAVAVLAGEAEMARQQLERGALVVQLDAAQGLGVALGLDLL